MLPRHGSTPAWGVDKTDARSKLQSAGAWMRELLGNGNISSTHIIVRKFITSNDIGRIHYIYDRLTARPTEQPTTSTQLLEGFSWTPYFRIGTKMMQPNAPACIYSPLELELIF
ncbi:unnamed protein product [Protopolystoma xenopodis]|uniref:Uncharacterized protein n=1 Tax=Protopolystoma xenopodis TaxID=117903 RepID=A0A448WBE3_9PLAT|nr:unnamed protein product [Protopolystoma xenopodis]